MGGGRAGAGAHGCPTCGQPLPEMRALRLDPATRTVVHGGAAMRLPPSQFRLLAALNDAMPRVLSTDFLSEVAAPNDPNGGPDRRTIAVHITRLRHKIAGTRFRIVNEWGAGYRLAPPAGE